MATPLQLSSSLPEPTAITPRASAPRPGAVRPRPVLAVLSPALSLLAALLLGFAACVVLIGAVQHDRDQEIAFDQLREQLATATAPVGPLDVEGKPLALGAPVALLEVPKLGLREVVLEGTTSEVTKSGVAHRRDTPLPGQVGTSVLVGRKAGFGGPFKDLSALQVGDTFTVVTGQGTPAADGGSPAPHAFKVTDVRRSGDPRQPLAAGAAGVTLVTASGPSFTPDGLLLVDAVLTTPVQPRPAALLSSASLPEAERALQGDLDAVYALVLWAQALLLVGVGWAWARSRWGRRQAWVVGVPVLAAVFLSTAGTAARLLPNVL